jgi:hypothetical protein
MDEYLPIETLRFCTAQLQNHGVDLITLQSATVLANGDRAHKAAYLQLRHIVREHQYVRALPELTLCPKVIGGYAEAQANESRLGQLIRENVDAADIARQRGDAQLYPIADEDAGWHIDAQVQNE